MINKKLAKMYYDDYNNKKNEAASEIKVVVISFLTYKVINVIWKLY